MQKYSNAIFHDFQTSKLNFKFLESIVKIISVIYRFSNIYFTVLWELEKMLRQLCGLSFVHNYPMLKSSVDVFQVLENVRGLVGSPFQPLASLCKAPSTLSQVKVAQDFACRNAIHLWLPYCCSSSNVTPHNLRYILLIFFCCCHARQDSVSSV